ncbi:MAG: potassium channel family protein [Sphingomicrobium sp.]
MRRSPLPPLRRRTERHDWQGVLIRTAIAIGLIGLAFSLLWFDRAGLRDAHDGHLSFNDILYFTMITISTVGYGDIVPVSERARLIDAFLITPIRLFVWLIFLGTAFDFLFKRGWENWRMRNIQRGLRNHIILAGFGLSGRKAMEELLADGVSIKRMVVVDTNEDSISLACEAGAASIRGDASRDEVLSAVHVERASTIIVSAGRDDSSILITLTARHLAPNARIAVGIRNVDNEDLARQAGADVVVNPVSFAGLLLASAAQGAHVAEYIADLVTSEGQVALRERDVRADEVGKSIRDTCGAFAVRIYRAGKPHSAWEPEAEKLQHGDRLLEIVPTAAA